MWLTVSVSCNECVKAHKIKWFYCKFPQLYFKWNKRLLKVLHFSALWWIIFSSFGWNISRRNNGIIGRRNTLEGGQCLMFDQRVLMTLFLCLMWPCFIHACFISLKHLLFQSIKYSWQSPMVVHLLHDKQQKYSSYCAVNYYH